MARYTENKDIPFGNLRDSRNISNTGTLNVSVWDGTDWILSDALQAGSREYFTKGLLLRFEISGGDHYYIEEGEQR